MIEALLNIMKNYIEHSPEGGKIEIEVEQQRFTTRFMISDEGSDIDSEALTKIFDRFYSCKAQCHLDSVGIGLSLVKKIVESQSDSIYARNKEAGGASFIVTLCND